MNVDDNSDRGRNRFLRLNPENRRKMRKRAWVVLYSLIALLVLVFLFGGQFGMISLIGHKRTHKRLERELALEQEHRDSLVEVLNRLKTDEEFLEKMARERLILRKEGERIYHFDARKDDE